MRLAKFNDGSNGYVLHMFYGCSAWFDATGKMLDAEKRDTRGRMRSIRPGSDHWLDLESAGKIYAGKTNAR